MHDKVNFSKFRDSSLRLTRLWLWPIGNWPVLARP